MTIYTSEKVLPYVYLCTNRETGEFYIGSRRANKTPSSVDFGNTYKTSAKYIKDKFNKFDWFIVAEFFDADDAYDFEQQLIDENWDNPLILNRSNFYGKKRLRRIPGVPLTESHKQNISTSKKGKNGLKGIKRPKPFVLFDVTFNSQLEAATHFNVHTDTIRKWIRHGKLPHASIKSVTVKGLYFDSFEAAATHFGVSRRTINRWVQS